MREGVDMMHPFNKPVGELAFADIEALIQNGIPEGRTLDYKRDLYGNSDAEKKEFLCDICAFANTTGGYLVIGVDEDKGIPRAVTPAAIEDIDEVQLQFENLLRTAVDPPIRGVDFRTIDAGDGKCVLVIAIPRSISRPHAVNHKGHWRFYGRNSVGKYPYEVDDVRRDILQLETLPMKIRNFRNDRLSQISVGNTPIPLMDGAKIVLHLIPVSAFELGQRYDLSKLSNSDFPPLYAGGWNRRVNYDGSVTDMSDRETGRSVNYTQTFYSGVIEAVDCQLLRVRDDKRIIPSRAYETTLVGALKTYCTELGRLSVEFPLWVCLSLLGVKNYVMWADSDPWHHTVHPIDREELILPEIQVEDASVSAERVLKPAFDSIWNACGYTCSMNYDESGAWLLRRQ